MPPKFQIGDYVWFRGMKFVVRGATFIPLPRRWLYEIANLFDMCRVNEEDLDGA